MTRAVVAVALVALLALSVRFARHGRPAPTEDDQRLRGIGRFTRKRTGRAPEL